MGRLGKKVLDGDIDSLTALTTVGMVTVADVQRMITSAKSWATPNKPGTIRKKGSSSPLIDLGRLRQSITFTVKGKGLRERILAGRR